MKSTVNNFLFLTIFQIKFIALKSKFRVDLKEELEVAEFEEQCIQRRIQGKYKFIYFIDRFQIKNQISFYIELEYKKLEKIDCQEQIKNYEIQLDEIEKYKKNLSNKN